MDSLNETTTVDYLLSLPYDPHEPQPVWNQTSVLIGIVATSLIVTWTCAGLRLWTRLQVVFSPGWDDVFVVLFMLAGFVASFNILLGEYFLY